MISFREIVVEWFKQTYNVKPIDNSFYDYQFVVNDIAINLVLPHSNKTQDGRIHNSFMSINDQTIILDAEFPHRGRAKIHVDLQDPRSFQIIQDEIERIIEEQKERGDIIESQ